MGAMKCLIIASAILVICVGNALPQSPNKSVEVYEAVVRYQIKSFRVDTYCIKIGEKDADKDFLRRLNPLPVKGASDCIEQTRNNLPPMNVLDKHTKRSAVIFDLGKIGWRSDTEADVDGGYLCASQCRAGGIYHVFWDGTRWVIRDFEIRVQS